MKTEKVTPSQWFLARIEEEHANTICLLRDKRLIKYLNERKDNWDDSDNQVIAKITEFAKVDKVKIRRQAYKTCCELGLVDEEFEKQRQEEMKANRQKKKKPSSHHSKLYNPKVGEFGFSCEEERMVIVFSHIKNKDMGNFEIFKRDFSSRYPYEASLLNDEEMQRLFEKYYGYVETGKMAELQNERRDRINSQLPKELKAALKSYSLRVSRADGRGTIKVVKKCRRKKQYDKDRLSGYRILTIKKGIPIAGKRFELYEDDIRDFLEKVGSGEINLDEVLEKERA